jgi:hypothetical protein
MGIAAFVLFIFGVYALVKRLRGKELSAEDQEFAGRLGRSVQGAIPIPALTGQPGAHMMPPRSPDEIGPEETHVVVLKAQDEGPDPSSMSVEEARARLDALVPPPRPRRRRQREVR